ncbi:MAG TPA: trimethylamine methyltransferase family protein, partial [Anaerolineales bacterium]
MTPPIQSISSPRISLNILSDEDIRKIHTATLDVIENVGVRFPSALACEVLASHGARVDAATQVAKIPGHLVEEALSSAPPSFTLAALDPTLDLPLDGNHSYLGTDGCGVEIIDPFSGIRRRPTKQDLFDIARVADAMPAIAFHWVPLSAQDCPPRSHSLHELEAIWSASRKHLQTEEIVHADEMRAAVEMASALAGGRDALRQRPLLSIMQCTISPLAQDGGSLEAALVAAEAGLPVGLLGAGGVSAHAERDVVKIRQPVGSRPGSRCACRADRCRESRAREQDVERVV